MAPQLQINQGPQDALLYDNSRSYFTNVGYVRTSNFQVEYKTVEAQNAPQWGSTFSFVIPKAADLLGPVDLQMEVEAESSGFATGGTAAAADFRAWNEYVDELGFAMLEKVTFSVGSNDIESITGEQLQIMNELMTSDEMRLGYKTILKTGGPAFTDQHKAIAADPTLANSPCELGLTPWSSSSGETDAFFKSNPNVGADVSRVISYVTQGETAAKTSYRKKLSVPLGLFFTKHVSQYFPLAAVAGCNDVRITIKLRPINSLIKSQGFLGASGTATWTWDAPKIKSPQNCRLMCHYVHVTGPEAQLLMNKEHVRLLKLFQHHHGTFKADEATWSMNLSFLHPVSTLIITIRREGDVDNSTLLQQKSVAADTTNTAKALVAADWAQTGKGFFFYHGDGQHPNYDADRIDYSSAETTVGSGTGTAASNLDELGTCKVNSISLTINGQDRHPGLDKGIDIDYLNSRLLPMLHSNSNMYQKQVLGMSGTSGANTKQFGQQGSKNIFVYPFSLNPEGSNPSGAVNFSKVSHAQLKLHMDVKTTGQLKASAVGSSGASADKSDFRVDVYALHYNWLQIKDGRALLSFA